MNWAGQFAEGLPYTAYLERYGTAQHRQRWQAVYDQIHLTDSQRQLLAGFSREMHLLCLAGTWCGDCVRAGPILEHIAAAAPRALLRFLDRDDHKDLAAQLAINEGLRVPVVVFLSEDDSECARYGERTLATYRKMAAESLGPACPTGVVAPGEDYLAILTQEWLAEIERVQLMLRLSPRLRAKHQD